jgi:hypothetical protein
MSSAVTGTPTQIKTSCPTLADLSGTPDDAYLEGEVGYVGSVRRYYQITRDTSLHASGTTIIPTFSGNGYWVALDISSDAWSYQPTWYIDATNGSDENDGSTALTALKTWGEFRRRVRLVGVSMTVNILTNLTEGIVGVFESLIAGLTLTINGTPTVLVDAGAATTFTDPVLTLGACARGTMTSGAVADFAPYVGKFLRTPAGKWAPILGSSAGAPYLPFWSDNTFGGGMNTKPANNTQVDIVALTSVLTIQLVTLGDLVPYINYLAFTSGDFDKSASVTTSNDVNGATFFACSFEGTWTNGSDCYAIACLLTGSGNVFLYEPVSFVGGGSTRSISLLEGGRAAFQGFIINGGKLQVGNGSSPGFPTAVTVYSGLGLGVFSSAGNGIEVGAGAIITGANLYGASNGGYGITVNYGGKVQVTAAPTITGTSGDLQFCGAATAIPPLTGGAAVPAASALATWAQWAAAPFNSKVVNYSNGSSLCI